MSKTVKNGMSAILIMIFLFSSITLLQQGVLGLQPNQTSSKNITSQATPQGTSLGSNETSPVPNAAPATPAQTQDYSFSLSPSSSNGGAITFISL